MHFLRVGLNFDTKYNAGLFVNHLEMLPLRNGVTMSNRDFVPDGRARFGIMHQVFLIRAEFLHDSLRRQKSEKSDQG